MSIVEVKGLCKKYPEFTLDNVDFSLEKGRITGFIGRNGAGKTTTIKSILNLVHPDAGEVSYFGMPLNGNEAEIKTRIGYSTGSLNYYPRKKLKDLIAVTKLFYPNWNDEAARRYAELFKLDLEKTPLELSEGMKVKCNLLLAMSHGAEVLILDEPTSGLDPFSRDELLDVFLQLRDHGVAILYSTHITSDLEKCADDILYIRNGKIIASETRERFIETMGQPGETLEEIMLRSEREARNE
ncbi:MAG: ABC transporter ATP-binding protein [Oscillospiraceae bacterium]|nr:ABC transporter ATP-binding protein [Oscillospiraceae bacterium]